MKHVLKLIQIISGWVLNHLVNGISWFLKQDWSLLSSYFIYSNNNQF